MGGTGSTRPLSLLPYFFVWPLVLPKVLLALNTPDGRAASAEQLARWREFAEAASTRMS